jgi:hypothetical protein
LKQSVHDRKASHDSRLGKLKSPGEGFRALEIAESEEAKLLSKASQHAA